MALTSDQHHAATTIDRSIGIVANAGAGKTRVLVERVAHILESGTARLSQLLVVTFTEKAAQELKTRLTLRLPGERLGLMTAAITTLHGFATRILRDHAPALGISASFQIASDGESAALLHRAVEETLLQLLDHNNPHATELCRRFKFRNLVSHLIPLLDDRWSFRQWSQSDAPRSETIGIITQVFAACEQHYTALKRENDILDFHDLEILTWKLFEEDARILSDYQRQFRHIMVDEFQDTNPLQATIVRQLFTPPDNMLCIVGDPKQSIYRFRHADVRCFAEMLATIQEAGGETVVLAENFRSTPGIVAFVNTACEGIPHYTPLVAQRPAAAFPSLSTIIIPCDGHETIGERRHCEAAALAKQLPQLRERHDGWGNMACLLRTRDTLQLWADHFRQAGIPIHVYSSGGFWERPEIRALLFPLHVIVGLETQRPDERHLLAMLLSPLFSVSLDSIYRWMHMMPAGSNTSLPPLHRAVFAHSPIGAQLSRWQQSAETQTPYELLTQIIVETQFPRQASTDALLRRLHLLERVRAVPLPEFLTRLTELQHLDERAPDTPDTACHDDAVQMMTIHAAKGNEFSCVILGDLSRGNHHTVSSWLFEPGRGFALRQENEFNPLDAPTPEWEDLRGHYQAEEATERQRLLYVALTRAERELVLPIHADLAQDSAKETRGTWHDQLAPITRHRQ